MGGILDTLHLGANGIGAARHGLLADLAEKERHELAHVGNAVFVTVLSGARVDLGGISSAVDVAVLGDGGNG